MNSPINRDVFNVIYERYRAENCGICRKPGGDVFWFSVISRTAHSGCCEKIKDVEAKLIERINSIFEDNEDANMAHLEAIESVQEILGDVSIETFLETKGAQKLKSIFDSVGVLGVMSYKSKLRQLKSQNPYL